MASLTDQDKQWLEQVALQDSEHGLKNLIHWMIPAPHRAEEFQNEFYDGDDLRTIDLEAKYECWSYLMGSKELVTNGERVGVRHANPMRKRYHAGLDAMRETQRAVLELGFIELAMKASEWIKWEEDHAQR